MSGEVFQRREPGRSAYGGAHRGQQENLEWSAQVKCPETDGDSPWPDSLNTFEGCDTQVGFDDYPLWVS